MPRRDRTGPQGQGPMTGGRRGLCSGSPDEQRGNFGERKRQQPIRRRARDGSCLQTDERVVPDEKDVQHGEKDDS
jgi:hypothetical protein